MMGLVYFRWLTSTWDFPKKRKIERKKKREEKEKEEEEGDDNIHRIRSRKE
jgi:hypothetical protein